MHAYVLEHDQDQDWCTDLCCNGEAANGRAPRLDQLLLPPSLTEAVSWLLLATGLAEARCALIGATAALFAACGLPAACRLLRCCSCMGVVGVWSIKRR
jgi:hypothetical protein